MELTENTRWYAQDPTLQGCATCRHKPVSQCERCRRQYCSEHLRLAAWKVAQVIPHERESGCLMMRPAERDAQTNMKLVCVDCAQALMNWG